MIKLVIVNGLGGSGKSTFCQLCRDYCIREEELNIVCYELSTVDYVKKVASICGWDGGKTQKDRIFLSDLKIAFEKWNNMPIAYMFNTIREIADEDKNYLFFVNSREPKDIEKIIEFSNEEGYECLTVAIDNPNVTVENTNEVPELIEGIFSIEYDYIINNDSDLEALGSVADYFVRKIFNVGVGEIE